MKFRLTEKTPDWLKAKAKRKIVEMSASAAAIHVARGELARSSSPATTEDNGDA